VKKSEDKKKINYAVANPEEFKKLQQTIWIEGRAAATEWRTCRDPVTDRESKLEKHKFVSQVISKKWQEQPLYFLKVQVLQE
jgi:hypothetical protein